jgi:hypothetical protein
MCETAYLQALNGHFVTSTRAPRPIAEQACPGFERHQTVRQKIVAKYETIRAFSSFIHVGVGS